MKKLFSFLITSTILLQSSLLNATSDQLMFPDLYLLEQVLSAQNQQLSRISLHIKHINNKHSFTCKMPLSIAKMVFSKLTESSVHPIATTDQVIFKYTSDNHLQFTTVLNQFVDTFKEVKEVKNNVADYYTDQNGITYSSNQFFLPKLIPMHETATNAAATSAHTQNN